MLDTRMAVWCSRPQSAGDGRWMRLMLLARGGELKQAEANQFRPIHAVLEYPCWLRPATTWSRRTEISLRVMWRGGGGPRSINNSEWGVAGKSKVKDAQ